MKKLLGALIAVLMLFQFNAAFGAGTDSGIQMLNNCSIALKVVETGEDPPNATQIYRDRALDGYYMITG